MQLSPDDNTGGEPSTPPSEPAEPQSAEPSEPPTEGDEPPVEPGQEPLPDLEAEPGQEEPVVEPEPTEPPVVDKTGDDKLPFNTHPRFKELVDEKNQYKREVEGYKGDAEQARQLNNILQTNQIRPEEFQNALKYLIALRTDPQAAFAMLEPTYNQLALLNGKVLPADLQAEVAAGTLTQERAAQIATAQAQQKYQQWRGQQSQYGQQDNLQSLVQQTTSMWEQSKIAADPDFKPGSPLYEQTGLRLATMRAKDLNEARENCEKAYTQAKTFLAGLQPRTVARGQRPPVSRPQNGNNGQVMKSAEDVVKAIRAGVKPAQMRYS